MKDAGGKWIKVCGWGDVVWTNREIVPNLVTVLNTWLPPRPEIPAKGACSYPHSPAHLPNLRTPPICLFFFRSVAHGAEKIVFITCQHLAALSYAMQDSIKLSYTGMKLQNRLGTPQQNYYIFFPSQKHKEVCLPEPFFDRQRCWIWYDGEKWLQKDVLGTLSFTLVVWEKRFWSSCDLCSGWTSVKVQGQLSILGSLLTHITGYLFL